MEYFFLLKPIPVIRKILLLFSFLIACGILNAQQTNVIFILGDDVGYEIPTINGGQSYITPNLSMMASRGMRFTNCYASPLCSPSRFMILTGKYNFRNYTTWGVMDQSQKTIANMFKTAGYKTAVYGKWQLDGGDASIKQFGFDNYCVFDPLTHSSNEETGDSRYKNPRIYQNGAYVDNSFTVNKYGDDIFCDSVLNFIDSNKSNPFFIYYPMCLSHSPESPTPEDSAFATWNPNNPSDTSFFPSMIKYMDEKIGAIINKVRSLGIEKNTLIVYVGDNGTDDQIFSMYQNQLVEGAKGSPIVYGTHVPLLVYWQNKTKGGSINNDLIDFTDFLPTLAEAANIPKPVNFGMLDGVSFAPRLRGGKGTPRSTVFCHFDPEDDPHSHLQVWMQNETYKLYDTTEFLREFLFYNVANDPLERRPLADSELTQEEKDIKAKFAKEMAQMYRGIASLSAVNVSDVSTSTANLSAQLISDNGFEVKQCGIAWSTKDKPNILGTHSVTTSGFNNFSASLKNLLVNTTYYARAYAISRAGTVYGPQIMFKTASLPAPVALNPTRITSSKFVATWKDVQDAGSYRLDVNTSPDFPMATIVKWTFPFGSHDDLVDTASILNRMRHISSHGTGIPFYTLPGDTTKSISADNWKKSDSTKYWQIVFSTIGFSRIYVFSKQASSSTGPRDFQLQYKVGLGGTWKNLEHGAVTLDSTFTSGIISNLLLPNDCNNQAAIYLRWLNVSRKNILGGNVDSAGTSSIDNIVVSNSTNLYGYDDLVVFKTSQTVSPLDNGTDYYYRVRAYTTKSLSPNSNVISVKTLHAFTGNVDAQNNIKEKNQNITVYPNPSQSFFTVKFSNPSTQKIYIKVTDSFGKLLYQNSGTPNKNYVFGEKFTAGIYIVEIKQGNNSNIFKVVKER